MCKNLTQFTASDSPSLCYNYKIKSIRVLLCANKHYYVNQWWILHSKPLRLKVAKSSKKDPNRFVSFGMITSYIFVYNYALASFGRKCVLCWFFKQIHGIFLSHGTLHHHCKLVSFLFYHVVLFLNNVLNSSGFQKILWSGHPITSWAWMHGKVHPS